MIKFINIYFCLQKLILLGPFPMKSTFPITSCPSSCVGCFTVTLSFQSTNSPFHHNHPPTHLTSSHFRLHTSFLPFWVCAIATIFMIINLVTYWTPIKGTVREKCVQRRAAANCHKPTGPPLLLWKVIRRKFQKKSHAHTLGHWPGAVLLNQGGFSSQSLPCVGCSVAVLGITGGSAPFAGGSSSETAF